jgi:hypothetical protein
MPKSTGIEIFNSSLKPSILLFRQLHSMPPFPTNLPHCMNVTAFFRRLDNRFPAPFGGRLIQEALEKTRSVGG